MASRSSFTSLAYSFFLFSILTSLVLITVFGLHRVGKCQENILLQSIRNSAVAVNGLIAHGRSSLEWFAKLAAKLNVSNVDLCK
jgi:hypothetical protein